MIQDGVARTNMRSKSKDNAPYEYDNIFFVLFILCEITYTYSTTSFLWHFVRRIEYFIALIGRWKLIRMIQKPKQLLLSSIIFNSIISRYQTFC